MDSEVSTTDRAGKLESIEKPTQSWLNEKWEKELHKSPYCFENAEQCQKSLVCSFLGYNASENHKNSSSWTFCVLCVKQYLSGTLRFFSLVTKRRKWKTFTLHHTRALMSVTIPSMYILPPLHQDDCFDLTAATRHAALPYMVATCHCPTAAGQRGWKKQGGCLELFFSPRLSRALCSALLSGP